MNPNLPEIFEHVASGARDAYEIISDASDNHKTSKTVRKAENEIIRTIATEEVTAIKTRARKMLTDEMTKCIITSASALEGIDPDSELYQYVKDLIKDEAFAFSRLGRQYDRIAGIDRSVKRKSLDEYDSGYISLDDEDYDSF